MAEIRPFRGVRYNDQRYADLSPVLAPPYDVISGEDYRVLREKSDRNVVRLILGDRFDATGKPDETRYAAVGQLLDDWLGDETLVQDDTPAVYLLDQAFDGEGASKVRRALIVRMRLEPFGRDSVYPHEQTMPGPKADRLALTRATRMNMSQVFGVYSDDGAVAAILAQIGELDPVAGGTGPDGVHNDLRAVYHRRLIEELADLFVDKRILIVDGHHRYETALAYRDEMRAQSPLNTDRPYEFVAMALVAANDPGLVIRPTHRLVSAKDFPPEAMFEKAAADFEVEEAATDAGAILARLGALADRHAFGLVTRSGSRIFVKKNAARAADGVAENLDSHILHDGILAGLLGMAPDTWEKGGPVRYVQDAAACIEAVKAGEAELAALMNPARMDEVEAVAYAGGRMPPKSTFFYPKVPTGTVINPLI